MKVQKSIWISYDLGVKGDYPGFYSWLDNNNAAECGDNIAFIKYETQSDEDIAEKIKQDLKSRVNFSKTDRVYIIWKESDGKIKGSFIIGKRKAAPWQGYGDATTEDDV